MWMPSPTVGLARTAVASATIPSYESSFMTPTTHQTTLDDRRNSSWAGEEDTFDDDDDMHDIESTEFETFLSIFVPALFSCVVVLGLVGNLLVILVVLFNRMMRSTTNLLIVSLAIADILFIVFCVPFTAYRYAQSNWPFGDFICKISQYVAYVTAYSSVYTLVLMSFDRFLAVVFPVGSMSIRTSQNASVVILITWLIICLANVPIAVDHGYFEYNFAGQTRSECVNLRIASGDKSYGQGLFGCFFAFAYVVPLVSICLLYGFMLTALAGHGGRTGGRPASSDGTTELNQNGGCRSANRLRCKKRVTRMVLVVVLVFAACWAPIQILLIIQHFGTIRSTELYTMFLVFGNCMSYLNSCVNPFLYAFLSENFRKSFCKMLCCAGLVASTAAFTAAGTGGNGAQRDLQLTNMRTATTTQMSKSLQGQQQKGPQGQPKSQQTQQTI